MSTKQKILNHSIHLFAMKGYTETTMRELAAVVGVKESSIYNHFPSKNAILECILEEFSRIAHDFFEQGNLSALEENPTADGILACIRLAFPEGKREYHLQQLYVILQEQHRNPLVRNFVAESFILGTEQVISIIIDKLTEYKALRPDIDADFWIKAHSSLVYAFASRMLLGIGDSAPEFSGKGLVDLLRDMYGMMLKTCGPQNNGITGPNEGGGP